MAMESTALKTILRIFYDLLLRDDVKNMNEKCTKTTIAYCNTM